MYLARIAGAAALLCLLLPLAATAQYEDPGYGAYGDYYQDPPPPPPGDSPSDQVDEAVVSGGCCDGSCCDGCCGGGCKSCGCDEPWEQCFKLYDDPCSGVRIGGWVDMSTSWNDHNVVNPAAGSGNLPVTFNYRDEQFQLQQAYLYAEKSIDDACCCSWQMGWRVDLLYGEDYIFTQAAGLETRPDFTNRWNAAAGHNGIGGTARNGLALPQAYVELGRGDLSVKVGHFYTIIGYESVMATSNFFLSHAYTMQYGEPFTHTGALASWDNGCGWTYHAGVVNGWDKFDAVTDRASFLGGATWTSCDEATSLAFAIITGEEDGAAGPPLSNRTMYSVVLSHQIDDCWTYVLQHDNGWWSDQTLGINPTINSDTEWYGVNQYLFYTINCCWSAGLRYEWFNDQHGTRVFPARMNGGHYHEVTAGLNYKPNGNVIVRPELRWDWFDAHAGSVNPATLPYNGGNDTSQFMAAVDLILLY